MLWNAGCKKNRYQFRLFMEVQFHCCVKISASPIVSHVKYTYVHMQIAAAGILATDALIDSERINLLNLYLIKTLR